MNGIGDDLVIINKAMFVGEENATIETMKEHQRNINGRIWIEDKAGAPYNLIATYKNGWEYSISYTTNNAVDIQNEINKIIESVKLEENDSESEQRKIREQKIGDYETVTTYEDGSITIKFTNGALNVLKDDKVGRKVNIEENVEYGLGGFPNNGQNEVYIGKSYNDHYGMPIILIRTDSGDLYYINTIRALETEKFSIGEKILTDVTSDIKVNLIDENNACYQEVKINSGEIYRIYRDDENGELTAQEYVEEPKDDNVQANNNGQIQPGDNIPIEDIIENFLNICATQQIPEAMLSEIGYNYIYKNERKSKEINGKTYYDLEIKYSDVKGRMLCYMTENLFDEIFGENYKDVEGNLYCYRGDYVGRNYTDTSAKYISSNGDIDKFLVITTANYSQGGFNTLEFEVEVTNRSVSKFKEIGVFKGNFGITAIEKDPERGEEYIVTGYALEDEIKKVSTEEFKKVRNGGKIDFRKEIWQLQNVQSNEHLTLVSDSGKKIALVMQDDEYACFASIAGAEGFCADYSDAKIKISLHKNANIKFWGGDDGITMEEFAARNYKSRSGKYAEYTPIIENNAIVGFRYFSD